MRAGTSRNEGAYNAGSGHGLSVNDVDRGHSQGDGRRFRDGLQAGTTRRRPRSVLDCTRARNDFGWECQTPFDAGLRDTWTWLRGQG